MGGLGGIVVDSTKRKQTFRPVGLMWFLTATPAVFTRATKSDFFIPLALRPPCLKSKCIMFFYNEGQSTATHLVKTLNLTQWGGGGEGV